MTVRAWPMLALLLVSSALGAATFSNPLLESGADPWVVQEGGFYYYYKDLPGLETRGLNYRTSTSFNLAALGVCAILLAMYAAWW